MNILLVEDEENLGRLLKEELEEQGYTITWLKNGVDAVLAALETAGFGVTLRQAQGDNVMVSLSNHQPNTILPLPYGLSFAKLPEQV